MQTNINDAVHQPMPTFLVIGAPKCGTTAMYHTLQQHPQIYMSSVKEPGFFSFADHQPAFCGPGGESFNQQRITRLQAYQALFQDGLSAVARGEASPQYLNGYRMAQTAQNLYTYLPQVKLIAILRQPIERAWSAFYFNRQRQREPLADFEAAWRASPSRRAANWPPGMSLHLPSQYYTNLQPYFALFPSEQRRIYLYEDWQNQPQSLLKDIADFLGVDASLMPKQIRQANVTYQARWPWVDGLIKRYQTRLPRRFQQKLILWIRTMNQRKPPALHPALRHRLTLEISEEIVQLQNLLGRDLSHWF